MKKAKITIVLPALNSKDYIKQCVDSILAQTLSEFELLCIDAGSTDGTLEMFHQYAASDERVRVIPSDMKSYGHQVNLGLDAANGEYFGIVESDDFIDSHMFEDLYALSKNGSVDVVKGNFYDYFDYDGMKAIAAPNGERHNMPANGTVFAVNDYPNILQGHPSIWSGIYRLEFLKAIHVRFMEIPGGGWTDNPFFFETLCAAKTIVWTSKPYYYYRKTNPNSSSNKIPDLTLPVRRMMDNLDVVERYPHLSDECLRMVYERAIIYLNGSIIDSAYTSQEKEIREWAIKLYKRLNERIIDTEMHGWFVAMYYKYISPLMLKRPRAGRILIYDYMPEDVNNRFMNFSEERICQIRKLLDARYDIDIYYLTVRNSHEPDKPFARIEKVFNHLSQQLFTFEVVNNPELTAEMFQRFSEMFGPFAAEYFISEKGISKDLLPQTASSVSSFEELLEIIQKVPASADVTFTAEEYQLLLRENDFYHRMLEDNSYGDIFDSRIYKNTKKYYKVRNKIRGGIRCCQEHGVPYTIKLFLKRGH